MRTVFEKGALALLAVVVVALSSAGCSLIRKSQAADEENLLGAAGFKIVAADTKERIAMLQTMTPERIRPTTRDGKTYYVYPDPDNCQCLWVGDEKAFQEYQRLRLERRIDDENLAASEDEEDAAELNWEVWGPWMWY